MVSSALATTYTTSGCFSNPTAPTAGTSASALCTTTGSTFTFNDLGGGTETLAYTDATANLTSGGMLSLGTFTFSSAGSGSGAFYGGNFTINFGSPSGTTGAFNAVLAGNQFGSFGGYTVTFSSLNQTFTSPNGTFNVTLLTNPVQVGSSNPSFTLMGTLISVPEPVSLALFGTGLAVLGIVRWRQRINIE